MTVEHDSERPLRADAQRNRHRILEAAREVFAARGLDVSLDDIAAHAGLGVGTVYRRFADKDALIDAVFEDRIGEVAAAARRALGAQDPWDGLVTFMHEEGALRAADQGLSETLLSRGRGRERVDRARDTIAPVVIELVRRAREAGRLRDDLGTFDLPMVQIMLSAVSDATRDVSPEVWQRFLGIVLDGMCTSRQEPTPLPIEPLDADQFAAAMTRHKTSGRGADRHQSGTTGRMAATLPPEAVDRRSSVTPQCPRGRSTGS